MEFKRALLARVSALAAAVCANDAAACHSLPPIRSGLVPLVPLPPGSNRGVEGERAAHVGTGAGRKGEPDWAVVSSLRQLVLPGRDRCIFAVRVGNPSRTYVALTARVGPGGGGAVRAADPYSLTNALITGSP